MFEHFDDRARRCVTHAKQETVRLGHAEIGAEHLLLGIAAVDEGLVGAGIERLRASVVAMDGVGDATPGEWLAFTPEAKAALEGANEQALSRGHTTIDPAHLLLSVLDSEGAARRILRESELTVADVRERATAAAGQPPRPADGPAPARAGRPDHAEDLRHGHPLTVTLGQDPYPIGDLGHPAVDAQLLALLLVQDSPAARLLRAHGIDEAGLRQALAPPGERD